MVTRPGCSGWAPGSIGNLGPGLDILGLAVAGAGDRVDAEPTSRPGIDIIDAGHPDLPSDPARHTAGIAAAEVLRRAGASFGVRLSVTKGLPLAGGRGGSAASAVAAAVAVNALLPVPLDRNSLILACLEAEATVAGRHADNIAPSLLGGAVLVRSIDPIDVVRLPCPPSLRLVIAEPAQRLRTAEARAVLPREVPLRAALEQAANIAGIVAALASGDLELLSRSLEDVIAEPVRAPLLQGFREAKAAALDAGALGVSISGAGPAAFALAGGDESAAAVASAMGSAYAAAAMPASVKVHRIDDEGARVEALGARTIRRSEP